MASVYDHEMGNELTRSSRKPIRNLTAKGIIKA